MYNLFMLKRLIMKKLLRNTVATVLCILSFTFILPVANAETNDTLKGMTLKEKIGQMITVEIRSFNNKNEQSSQQNYFRHRNWWSYPFQRKFQFHRTGCKADYGPTKICFKIKKQNSTDD